MINRSNFKKFQIKVDKIKEKRTQNKILLEKLDTEALEFELQRNHDAYLLGLERFNSLKDNARFQLGILGLIGTVVMTILFSIAGVKQFFEITDMNDVLFFWCIIFILEILWLLHNPTWTRRECIMFSQALQRRPDSLQFDSDEVYDKKSVIISDILEYNYQLDVYNTIFEDGVDQLNKNESLIFEFITGTIFSILFFFIFGLLPGATTGDTDSMFQLPIVIETISIFFWQLFPVILVIYGFIKRKIQNIKYPQGADT
jgi:hypothetical protein